MLPFKHQAHLPCTALSIALLATGTLLGDAMLRPHLAHAQDEVEEVKQIVILDVPLEGTRTLAESIATLGDAVALYPQAWFEERVTELGLAPEGLLSKRESLSIVMEENEIDVIIFTRYSAKRESYRVTFISQDEAVEPYEFDVLAIESEGLTGAGAVKIRKELLSYFARQKTNKEAPKPDPVDDTANDPNALRDRAIAEKAKEKQAGPKGAAKIAAGFRLIEPTLLFVTAGSETVDSLAITLGSAPGFAIYAEVFPMLLQEGAEEGAANFGILLNYNQVFKSPKLSPTTVGQEEGVINEPVETQTSYLDFEAGAFYNMSVGSGKNAASLRGKLLLRVQRLSTSVEVSQFQTFRFVSIGVGADAIFPLGTTGAKLISSTEIAPFTSANPLPQADLGTTRFAYTLSGSLGISYDFTPNIGFSGSYIFDSTRILFNKEVIPPPTGSTDLPRESSPKAIFSANGLFLGIHYVY